MHLLKNTDNTTTETREIRSNKSVQMKWVLRDYLTDSAQQEGVNKTERICNAFNVSSNI